VGAPNRNTVEITTCFLTRVQAPFELHESKHVVCGQSIGPRSARSHIGERDQPRLNTAITLQAHLLDRLKRSS
jgi:hypothetical protein